MPPPAQQDALWDRRWAVTAVLVLLGVLALGTLAVRFAPAGSSVAVWWPAAGLSAAFLLATGPDRRRAAVVVGGLVLVTGVANSLGGRPPVAAVCFGFANAAEAALFWHLMTRRGHHPRLASADDLGRLVVATIAGALAFGVLAGLAVVVTLDGTFFPTAYAVAASHTAAVLTMAPLGIALSPRSLRGRRLMHPRRLENALQSVALLAVVFWVFGSRVGLPLAFLPLPVLVWGATRLSLRTLAAQLVALGVVVVVLTSRGGGPFAAVGRAGGEPETVGALTQAFLVTATVTALALAVATTQRRDALTEERTSRTLVETVLESAEATAIIGTDASGVVSVFSRGATNLLGFEPGHVVGSLNWLDLFDTEEVAARAAELGIAVGPSVLVHSLTGPTTAETRDWTWVTRDGRRLVVDLTTSAIADADGRVTGYVGVAEDVTERRQAADAVQLALQRERRAVEELTALDRAKTDFLSAVSHELRTPLASVLGYAEMLEDGAAGDLSPRQQDLVSRIDRNGRRLLTLIEDLLLNSRIESGQLHLARARCDLGEVVEHAWDGLGPMTQGRDLRLHRQAGPGVVPVEGDPAALERAVSNLLSNAVKFTPDGGTVTLSLSTTPPASHPAQAELVVTDTGYGIAAHDLPQVFRRFFRSAEATDKAIQGTGLGLSIVKAIVEGHDGTLHVASTPGQGSTFTMRLPLIPVD
jgi:PAS domain S-box-containing protein